MRFKERFHELDHADIVVWEWPQDPLSLMYMQAALVRDWAEQECVVGRFPRNDYRELCELLTVILGGQVCSIFLYGEIRYQTICFHFFFRNILIISDVSNKYVIRHPLFIKIIFY